MALPLRALRASKWTIFIYFCWLFSPLISPRVHQHEPTCLHPFPRNGWRKDNPLLYTLVTSLYSTCLWSEGLVPSRRTFRRPAPPCLWVCAARSQSALGPTLWRSQHLGLRRGSICQERFRKVHEYHEWCASGVQVVYHLILCTTQYHLTITWPIEPQVRPHQLWSQFTIGDFSKSLTQLKQCSFQLLDLKASLGVEKSSGLQHGNQLQMADSSSDPPSPYQYKQDTVLPTQLAGKKGS